MSGIQSMRSIAVRLLPSTVQRVIRRWLNESRRTAFKKRIIRRRYGDFCPLVELVDHKGADWYDYDRGLDPEIVFLKQRGLVPKACVFDVGAHQGVVALALAQIVGPAGRVLAVEANSFDARAAKRNAHLNGFQQVNVLNVAVASRRGTVALLDSGRVAISDPSRPAVDVEAQSLDDLAIRYGTPAVLFVDVDGFENQVLQGATEVLKTRPACYVEVHSELLPRYGDRAEETVAFFPEYDYELWASHEMRTSHRVFQPMDRARFDFSRGFHLLAIARNR
jgi:FkbM family methyltransferase